MTAREHNKEFVGRLNPRSILIEISSMESFPADDARTGWRIDCAVDPMDGSGPRDIRLDFKEGAASLSLSGRKADLSQILYTNKPAIGMPYGPGMTASLEEIAAAESYIGTHVLKPGLFHCGHCGERAFREFLKDVAIASGSLIECHFSDGASQLLVDHSRSEVDTDSLRRKLGSMVERISPVKYRYENGFRMFNWTKTDGHNASAHERLAAIGRIEDRAAGVDASLKEAVAGEHHRILQAILALHDGKGSR